MEVAPFRDFYRTVTQGIPKVGHLILSFIFVLFTLLHSPVSILDGPTAQHAPVSILDAPQP